MLQFTRSVHTTAKQLPPQLLTKSKFKFPKHTHTVSVINESLDQLLGAKVILSGWINQKPKKMGKGLIFAEFRDFNGGLTQLVSKDLKVIEELKKLQVEDCIVVNGSVEPKREKKDGSANASKTWDLRINEFRVLNKANILSSQLNDLKNTNPKEFPPSHRYLQLRHSYYQNTIKTRSKVSQIVRQHLHGRDFTEIETPLLFKSTPEGAREFIVPTRQPNQFYALPQSPQQYKQLLMASGFKNYFQIAKCFRDEDLRKDRQPEFTQVDLEMSFVDKVEVQEVIESTVQEVWTEIKGEPIKTIDSNHNTAQGDLIHLDYDYVLGRYGIDKPDLRSTLTIQDLSLFATAKEHPDFPVFEVMLFKNLQSIPKVFKNPKEYKNRAPYVILIKTEEDLLNWTKKFEQMADFNASTEEINRFLNLEIGDVIAGSTRATLPYENPTPLGRLRQLAIDVLPTSHRLEDAPYVGAWIENFPLFNPVEIDAKEGEDTKYPKYDYESFESTHHPFTMVDVNDYVLLGTDPLKARGDHYDLVLNGMEIGGGSRRIHDPALQDYIFSEILKIPDPERLFGHLLEAFKHGTPPHAGFAIGFDRMCAILVDSESIRDVIAFPKTMAGADMVVGSPSAVSDEVLGEYYVKRLTEE